MAKSITSNDVRVSKMLRNMYEVLHMWNSGLLLHWEAAYRICNLSKELGEMPVEPPGIGFIDANTGLRVTPTNADPEAMEKIVGIIGINNVMRILADHLQKEVK